MTYQKDRITEIINSRYLFQRVIQDLIHDLKKRVIQDSMNSNPIWMIHSSFKCASMPAYKTSLRRSVEI